MANDVQFASLLCATRNRCFLTLHYVGLHQLCSSLDRGVQNFLKDLLIRAGENVTEPDRDNPFNRLKATLRDGTQQQIAANNEGRAVPIAAFMKSMAALTLPTTPG